MNLGTLRSPIDFLDQGLSSVVHHDLLRADEAWWNEEGKTISDAIDRAGTPWLRMFDKSGARADEILYPPDYWRMLRRGYRSGVSWLSFEGKSPIPSYLLMYAHSFFDPGVCCPYTVSLATAFSL